MSTETPNAEPKKLIEPEWVTKTVYGYNASTGFLPIRDDKGEIDALIFATHYAKPETTGRPLIFAFNGGPGSPSLWLHLGALGPVRIPMGPNGTMPKPPYALEENTNSWLEFADLVFLDPVGTGYSEAINEDRAKTYWGMKGDIESIAEAIRVFLNRTGNLNRPIYLAGESYGTMRAAGVARALLDHGIACSGLMLISSVLNFQTLRHYVGNDLVYPLFLPSFAATSWYHNAGPEKHFSNLTEIIEASRDFSLGEYSSALMQGDNLSETTADSIAEKVAEFTGISKGYILKSNLRLNIHRYCKELLREKGITVGRLDSRTQGQDLDWLKSEFEHDPSMSALMAPYAMSYQQYVREVLGYETEKPYHIFRGVKKPWTWDMPEGGPPDTSICLSETMVRNPWMRVLVASGYFDLATPFVATEYTMSHLGISSDLKKQILIHEYEAGHMMYTHEDSLHKLAKDVREFVQD